MTQILQMPMPKVAAVGHVTNPARLCDLCHEAPGLGDPDSTVVLCQPCAIEIVRHAFHLVKPKVTAVGTVFNPPEGAKPHGE